MTTPIATPIAHDSAYLASLSVTQLFGELSLAASRLACVHLVEPRDGWPAACHECGVTHKDDLLSLPHREGCRTGNVARVLYALACGEVAQRFDLHSTPPRKETTAPKDDSTECDRAAAREMRPRPFLVVTGNALPGLYAEPWAIDETGAVHDAQGNTIADPVGCELVEPDDARAMQRLVACVNYCDGIATAELERAAATRIGGAM